MARFHIAYEKPAEYGGGVCLGGQNVTAEPNDFEGATTAFKNTFKELGSPVPPIIYVHQHLDHIEINHPTF